MDLEMVLITFMVAGLILIFLAGGMWIAAAMGLVGIILLVFFVGGGKIGMIGMLQFNSINSFLFTCAPLFIFMGQIIMYSGLADKLYKGATDLVGFLPGGLVHTNVAACAIFAAISGSSTATAATIGTVAIPQVRGRGYDKKLVYGSLAAGGTLGPLIPPSLVMIIYGAVVGESIGKLFIGGVFPGLALAGLFMLYIGGATLLRPSLAPERLRFSLNKLLRGLVDIWPVAVLIFMVLGTIYLGLATPTEAAAIGATMSLIFCAAYRKLTWQVLMKSGIEALVISCWALFIVVAASVLAMALSALHLPAQLAAMVSSFEVSRYVILALVILLYVILGMFIDSISMMLLTLPVIYPLMITLGFDSVWFGILLVVLIEVGMVTPPYGLNCFIIHGISGGDNIMDVIMGVIPFMICMFVLLILLIIFPDLALWLPAHMFEF